MIDLTIELFESPLIRPNNEFQLQVFKILTGTLQVISGDDSSGRQSLFDLKNFVKIQEVIGNVIESASKPYFYSDEITLEYLTCLTSLVG